MNTVTVRWIVLRTLAVLVGACLILSTLIVIPMWFNGSSTLGVSNGEWTTEWYRNLLGAQWATAATNSP